MRSTFAKSSLVLAILLLWAIPPHVSAEVEWHIENTLKTGAAPADIVVSADGQTVFVLTDDGNVLIYDRGGKLKDTIKIGPHVDQIRIDPQGEQLFATSRRNKTVEVIELSFIHDIDTTGSPFKGPQDAPVVMAVFSDFQ
jgi:DNA-binding beta-propeller fold protein YncE